MKKYFLLLAIPFAISACNINTKDKVASDSKTDSLRDAEQRKADADKLMADKKTQEEAMKNTTTVQLIDSVFNFGTITEGEKVEFSYKFKNTGTNPLIIFDAHASCGCTVPEKPEKPIMPGEIGFLKVVFNSAGKASDHLIEKTVNVSANANPAFPGLKLTGEVKGK